MSESGDHGLVAAQKDQGAYKWGCSELIVEGANGKGLFEGKQNTKNIVNKCTDQKTSANIAQNLALNGFNDWYLPSKDELNLMYKNLYKKGLGNFKNEWYHSSTQKEKKTYFSGNFVWHQKFDDEGSQIAAGKVVPAQVRVIRAF